MKKILFTLLFIFICLGANAQLGFWTMYGFIELTPDESFTYKYVQTLDAKSQETINGLYACMKEKGDKSILKQNNVNGWFVRKGYPLPEGNYYESDFYNSSSTEHANEVYFVLPQVQSRLNSSGRIEDLLEYLGDRVTVDFIKEQEIEDVKWVDFRFISNLKTSEEWLKLCMTVSEYGFAGLPHFNPGLIWINRTYDSNMVNMMTESNDDVNMIYSMNWEGVRYPMTGMSPDDPQKTTDEGLAIFNPEKQEYAGSIFTIISGGGFSLEKNHDYVVRLTMKVPSDGSYVLNIGSGSTNSSKEVAVSASDDFQVVDVLFPDFWGDVTDRTFEPIDGDAHIFFYSGLVTGTTVVKKVEVYELAGSTARGGNKTAINAVKATNVDGAIYNLSGQKVDAFYKGIVIQNGKKRIAR